MRATPATLAGTAPRCPGANGSYSAGMFPPTLSPSRAGDFLTCPLLYRLRVIDKLPEPPSAAALRGTLVHAALEDLFALPPKERTIDRAVDSYAEHFDKLRVDEPAAAACLMEGLQVEDPAAVPAAVVQPARILLETYFRLEDPQRLAPHARELAVSTDLDNGLVLRGFVDRVDKAPDGRVRLIDYKTGRSPGEGFESKALFQMRFYALVWWRMTGEVPSRLQLLYLGNEQVLAYDPTAEELQATERKILAIHAAINRAVATGFVPSPSALCRFCSFHEWCPEQGGVTPQMPEVPT